MNALRIGAGLAVIALGGVAGYHVGSMYKAPKIGAGVGIGVGIAANYALSMTTPATGNN